MNNSWRNRIIGVFIGALVLLAAVIVLRPSSAAGIPKALFWQKKLAGDETFSVVAAGDSRTLRDIVPEELEACGLGKALNFGFQGASFGEEFIDAAVSRLERQKTPVLLLGVTPNGFTPNAERSNGFDKEKSDSSPWGRSVPNWFLKITQQLEPVSLAELRQIVSRRRNPKQERYYADGWLETLHKSPNEKYAIRFYRDRFSQNMVSQKSVDRLLEQVAELTKQNIRVFAYRPPITQALGDIENDTSGFEYAEFISAFESAGGDWIVVVDEEYQTYDGSHLVSESARKLTRKLAEEIAAQLGTTRADP